MVIRWTLFCIHSIRLLADEGNWYTSNYDRHNSLYITDLQEQRNIDSCRAIGVGMAWHPNKHQLVILSPGDGARDVLIFDLDDYELHSIAKHIVGHNRRDHFTDYITDTILGWRAD